MTHQGETLTVVGPVQVPGSKPPSVLVAALGPMMLRLAGEHADGTVTWMTGPKTLADHIVPSITRAAQTAGRAAPRIVAGLIVCVTNDEATVRERIAEEFAVAGQVPEYRRVLDREGVNGPQDVVIVGTETTVTKQLQRLADAGVTDFIAAPYGSSEQQRRTIEVMTRTAR